MKFLRFLLLFFMITLLQAKQYNIILFSTKVVYDKDKEKFFKIIPNGIIEKQKKYYTFKINHIKNYTEAKKILKNIKKYYHDSFIVFDKDNKKNISLSKNKKKIEIIKFQQIKTPPLIPVKLNKKNNISKTKKELIQENIEEKSPINPISIKNEPKININDFHIPLTSKKISYINNKPKLNEPKILESYQIPDKYKTSDTNIYDILNLRKYIDALFNYNDSAKEAYYQKKIDYVLSEIKKDKYGFDIYVDGYLRTGTSVSTNGNNIEGNGDYTNAGVSLNANKLLYDGRYWLTKHTYDILYKRLAQIKEINAKEKLLILGTSIYTDLYTAQEELKMYSKILKQQKILTKIIDESYKKGANSILDHISSHDDLINIQRNVLDAKYRYKYNDYILRQSIKSRSKKPFKLYPAKIELNTNSLKILQKEAIKQSSDIAIQSNILKIKETDLQNDQRRYYPKINFTSNIGYGLNKDDIFTLSGAGRGTFWSLGLNFKIPIYQRKDIILSKERDRYNILKQKRILSAKQRAILSQVEKSYNEIKRIKKQKLYLFELVKLSSKKLKILTERYLSGVSPYKNYSDALSKFLNYKNQLIKMDQNYIKEISLLSILVGKKKFYEQN